MVCNETVAAELSLPGGDGHLGICICRNIGVDDRSMYRGFPGNQGGGGKSCEEFEDRVEAPPNPAFAGRQAPQRGGAKQEFKNLGWLLNIRVWDLLMNEE